MKAKNPTLYLFLGVCLVFQSCIPRQKVTSIDELPKLLEMSKGPCYGPCPVFKLTIYRNGLASYVGERYTEREGTFYKNLDRGQIDKLVADCKAANLWQFPDAYRSQYPDLPTVTITYFEADRSKTILGKEGRPEVIMNLEASLDKIADSGGWADQNGDKSSAQGKPRNEIIVQLLEGVDGNVWSRQYAKNNMKVVKRLSGRGFYWLVTFDDKTISPDEMLANVQKDSYVVSAEFNTTVEWRE